MACIGKYFRKCNRICHGRHPGLRGSNERPRSGGFHLKNISAQPLNFAAEELTERFVRGDVARGTEGSGLGLSIAKSLTELQGGKFQLYLDGDLFKVTITFQAQNSKCTDAEVPAQPKPEAR